jgi:hypothetical protein
MINIVNYFVKKIVQIHQIFSNNGLLKMKNDIPNNLTFSTAEKLDAQPYVRGFQEVVFSVQNLDV